MLDEYKFILYLKIPENISLTLEENTFTFQSPTWSDDTVGTSQVSMTDEIRAVQVHHPLDQVVHKGGDEHRVQLDVHVLQYIVKSTLKKLFFARYIWKSGSVRQNVITRQSFSWLKTFGYFYLILIGWFKTNIVKIFQPIILIYIWRHIYNLVYHR